MNVKSLICLFFLFAVVSVVSLPLGGVCYALLMLMGICYVTHDLMKGKNPPKSFKSKVFIFFMYLTTPFWIVMIIACLDLVV